MKVSSRLKSHTLQSALDMLSVDHLNIDGPPFPVKCVRKFRSALGGEVTYRCVCDKSSFILIATPACCFMAWPDLCLHLYSIVIILRVF